MASWYGGGEGVVVDEEKKRKKEDQEEKKEGKARSRIKTLFSLYPNACQSKQMAVEVDMNIAMDVGRGAQSVCLTQPTQHNPNTNQHHKILRNVPVNEVALCPVIFLDFYSPFSISKIMNMPWVGWDKTRTKQGQAVLRWIGV